MNMDNNYIPTNCYIDSLIQYLLKMPNDLIENDYEILFDEMENEVIKSIKELNFEDLNKFIKYSTEIEKEIL